MYEQPPRRAERLLLLFLGRGDDARAILGDLAEDYATVLRDRGARAARRWYWREAITFGLPAGCSRLFGRGPLSRSSRTIASSMNNPLSTLGIYQDAYYALRSIRRDRGFFVFATLIIGLGVGASTAVFSVMSPLLLQPLPFEEPGQLVWIANGDGTGGQSGVTSRTSNLRDFREQSRSFDGLSGYNAFFDQASYNLVGSGEPERLVGVGVAQDFLDVLGVEPALGRNFVPEEGIWDGRPAVILTHGFWMRRFAGDPSIVGTALTINDTPTEVVGILPEHFDFWSVFTPTTPVDFLLTWAISDETDRWGNTTAIVGRLKPGVSVTSAQAELDNILEGLREADPERWGLGGMVSGLQDQIARPFRSGMLLLAAAAGLVMLIVCVNLSNMLLARSPRRRREMAVRRTMGATRGRLVRQLLIESLVISSSGAFVGLGLAAATTEFVSRTSGLEIPMLGSIAIDGAALAFTVVVAVLAGLVVGMVPALQVAEGGEAKALSGSSRGSTASRNGRRLRELLVISEVAMACVLLVFGGLVLRSFQHVMDVELGFQPENSIAWQLNTTRDFETLAASIAFFDAVIASVEAVPGVEAAALTDALPLGRNRTWGTRVLGKDYRDDEGDGFFPHIVDHRYHTTMGIPLVEGRLFSPEDTGETAMVIVVNEAAAQDLFGGQALGQFIMMGGDDLAEVVGVVGNVKHRALELGADNEVYFHMAQMGDFQSLDMVVRSRLPAASVASAVGEAIRENDPQMPIEDFWTLESVVERSVSPRRFTLQLLAAFATSALLLAGLGIYSVLSYSVTERIPEIGIRMALGESAAEVRQAVVSRTVILALAGVGLGTVTSLLGARMLGSLLFGVEPWDPVTFAAMITLLLVVAVVSGLVPAIRASRTDSASALRSVT